MLHTDSISLRYESACAAAWLLSGRVAGHYCAQFQSILQVAETAYHFAWLGNFPLDDDSTGTTARTRRSALIDKVHRDHWTYRYDYYLRDDVAQWLSSVSGGMEEYEATKELMRANSQHLGRYPATDLYRFMATGQALEHAIDTLATCFPVDCIGVWTDIPSRELDSLLNSTAQKVTLRQGQSLSVAVLPGTAELIERFGRTGCWSFITVPTEHNSATHIQEFINRLSTMQGFSRALRTERHRFIELAQVNQCL